MTRRKRKGSSQKQTDDEFLRLVDRGIEEDKSLLKKLAKLGRFSYSIVFPTKGLPKIDPSLERLADQDSLKIIDVMLRLFAAKTGLECE